MPSPLPSTPPVLPSTTPITPTTKEEGKLSTSIVNEKVKHVPEVDAVVEEEVVVIAPPQLGAIVDMDVFGQLLEIDDDDTHDFSKTLAFDYIKQAETTFKQIDVALASHDLPDLSRKGHFLKGSSAALGLQKVQRSCELMQHYGNKKDENGDGPEVADEVALGRCKVLLGRLREEQEEARRWLEGFYRN